MLMPKVLIPARDQAPKSIYRSNEWSTFISNTLRREVEATARRGLRPHEVAIFKARAKAEKKGA